MVDNLKVLNLRPTAQAAPSEKPAQSAGPDAKEGVEARDFASVLKETKSEKEKDSSSHLSDSNTQNPSDANGLAAGSQKALPGEDGSSRSASLSPNEPDLVEEIPVFPSPQFLLGVPGESLFQLGGEDPFLPGKNSTAVTFEIFQQASPGVPEQAAVAQKFELPVGDQALPKEFLAPQQEAGDPLAHLLENRAAQPQANPALKVSAVEVKAHEKEGSSFVREAAKLFAQDPAKSELNLAAPALDPGKQPDPKPEIFSSQIDAYLKEFEGKRASSTTVSREEKNPSNLSKHENLNELLIHEAESSEQEVEEGKAKTWFDKILESVHYNAHKKEKIEGAAAPVQLEELRPQDPIRMEGMNREAFKVEVFDKISSVEELKPFHRVIPGSVEDQVLRQIKFHLGSNADKVEIRLFPPELGALRIQFEMEGNQMKGRIHASEGATAAMLERYIPELRQSMQDAGINVRDLEVAQNSFLGSSVFQESNQSRENQEELSARNRTELREAGEDGGEDSFLERRLELARINGGIDYLV